MKKRAARIFLVGMMGAGKSTVGKALALELGWRFVDTDRAIEKKAGSSIEALFRDKGEAYFRRLEARVLRALAAPRSVVSTGGGAVLLAANRKWMKSAGVVVYLKASPERLWQRLKNERAHRPLLAAGGERAALKRIYGERRALYDGADFAVMAGRPVERVVSGILRKLANHIDTD